MLFNNSTERFTFFYYNKEEKWYDEIAIFSLTVHTHPQTDFIDTYLTNDDCLNFNDDRENSESHKGEAQRSLMRATALIGMAPGLDPSTYDHAEIERYGVGQGMMITFRSLISHRPIAWYSPPQLTSSTISNHFVYHNFVYSPSFVPLLQAIPCWSRQSEGSTNMSLRSHWDHAPWVSEVSQTWQSRYWLRLLGGLRYQGWIS